MLDLLVWAFWFIFGAYSFWFFTKAKTLQPLTLAQLALGWKLHKQQAGCKASRIDSLVTRNDEVVGFKCDCGYEFQQKRLITQRAIIYPRSIPKSKHHPQNVGLLHAHFKKAN